MGAVDWVFAGVATIALPTLVAWLRSEISVWHEPLIKWLVRRGASTMPASERTACEAEWLAMIEHTRSPTWKLVHAASLFATASASRDALHQSKRTAVRPLWRRVMVQPRFWLKMLSINLATIVIVILIVWAHKRYGLFGFQAAATALAVLMLAASSSSGFVGYGHARELVRRDRETRSP